MVNVLETISMFVDKACLIAERLIYKLDVLITYNEWSKIIFGSELDAFHANQVDVRLIVKLTLYSSVGRVL